jgi:hypothetical protein
MSSINPNNVNGQYPIAGQDNDSQGFRDNFTNIKDNLKYAYNEITDLQNNAVLKSALTGGSINNDMNYSQLVHAQLLGSVETLNDLGSQGSTLSISWSDGHFQYFTTTGDVTISAFTEWPTSELYTKLRLQITTDTTNRVITFPTAVSIGLSNIQGVSGQAVTLPTAGVYIFELTSYDSGTTIVIQDLLRNYTLTNTAVTGSFTNVNASGNILAQTGIYNNLTVNGNVAVGKVGAVSGSWTTVVGNITQTTSGGAVYFNTTGNVLAASATFGALTVNGGAGFINTSGNVSAAVHTGGAVSVTGYINTSGNVSAAVINAGSIGTVGAITSTGFINTSGNVSAAIYVGGAVTVSGAITSSAGGVGYATGAGGVVQQGTSKSTSVTLNAYTGNIQLFNTAIAANCGVATFTVVNSKIAAGDFVLVQHDSNGTLGAYSCQATGAAGSATVYVTNMTQLALSEAIWLKLAVIKGVLA